MKKLESINKDLFKEIDANGMCRISGGANNRTMTQCSLATYEDCQLVDQTNTTSYDGSWSDTPGTSETVYLYA